MPSSRLRWRVIWGPVRPSLPEVLSPLLTPCTVSWTFSSSLAGLLWVSILKQKGIHVSGKEFAGWNLAFLPILSTVSSGIILLETYYF